MLIIILQLGTRLFFSSSLGLVTLISMREIQDGCTVIKVYKTISLKHVKLFGAWPKSHCVPIERIKQKTIDFSYFILVFLIWICWLLVILQEQCQRGTSERHTKSSHQIQRGRVGKGKTIFKINTLASDWTKQKTQQQKNYLRNVQTWIAFCVKLVKSFVVFYKYCRPAAYT